MKAIVVCEAGFVFIGEYYRDSNTITNASCIRRWGTTKGLGEIALSGPTNETVLDACGVVHLTKPPICLIECVV